MQMEELAMNTKLVINMSEGTVQVEGTEEFVRFVYQDFKEHLGKNAAPRPALPVLEQAKKTPPLLANDSASSKKRSRKAGPNDGATTRTASAYKPRFNTTLDLSALEQFFDDWKPENNFEKILVFAVFLRNQLDVAPCTADDIYTCFATLRRKG